MLPVPVLPCVAEDRPSVQESDTQGQAVSDRNYLNALVQTSTANTDNQARVDLTEEVIHFSFLLKFR